ncbi:MAG TPA: VWA domain-containing protein [Nitrososphaeraceae archaeon]|nr:VWA domain-containing protein [Nitrososphaeraceae archaeon]
MTTNNIKKYLRNDVLLDIAIFLARRWSNNPKVIVILSKDKAPQTDIEKQQIILPTLNYFHGEEFQRYRQWRVSLWYESMRIRYTSKVKVSRQDHAYGFILNSIETKRIEILGLDTWQGMANEIIFYEGMSWLSKPLLNTIYGRHKIIEAFSQYFLTGYIKGELFGSEFDKVKQATDFANECIREAIDKRLGTDWIYDKVREIIKILQIDPLLSIPLTTPRSRIGMAMNKSDLFKQLEKVIKSKLVNKEFDLTIKEIIEGKDVVKEYDTLLKESKKSETKGYDSLENFHISIPNRMDINESEIYDLELIQKIKSAFRDWKTGWIEVHQEEGDELDTEAYIDSQTKPFLTDYKISIRTKVVILLDHSSSIEEIELKYKQATLALCEALSYLGIDFAVYAFSTEAKKVKCWLIKPPKIRWSVLNARRLAQIRASGGTPLAEIYTILLPFIKSFKPEIMITLTDGEPSNYDAVKEMVLTYRSFSIHMVALGLGKNLNDLINIGHNLKYLNYNKTLASRVEDIPKKVINLLKV